MPFQTQFTMLSRNVSAAYCCKYQFPVVLMHTRSEIEGLIHIYCNNEDVLFVEYQLLKDLFT